MLDAFYSMKEVYESLHYIHKYYDLLHCRIQKSYPKESIVAL